jgi:cyclopropane-fatty-acyl-phospholipid synthase
MPVKNWLMRRLWAPLLGLLRQGVSPDRLALCVAIGIVVGNIPILGTSTIICTLIALLFRLNLPAMQLVQAAMAPLQVLLIIPYVRLGEWLLRVPHQSLSISAGLALMKQGPATAVTALWDAILHASVAFLLVGPVATFLLYRMLRPVFLLAARNPLPNPEEPGPSSWSLRLLERGLVPDHVIRRGILRLLRARLVEEDKGGSEAQRPHLMQLIGQLKQSPVAINTADANAQHYELPPEFFELVLGKHLKYSSCYYPNATDTLDEAEAHMLALTAERAGLRDGESILELGCGWGSLSLWMAEHFPNSTITAVSNSRGQKRSIDARAAMRGLKNLQIMTADMNDLNFGADAQFDRVVSVEMFEHMRNYEVLMQRIAGWLKPGGTLFVHIFAHRLFAYPFEVRDETDWMAKYFFTGGIMPSDDLLLHFQKDLKILEHWRVDGSHYQKTCEAWLANMDRHRARIEPIFEATYGADQVRRWWVYWRVFFMSCAELFGYAGGHEWQVSHYLFSKAKSQPANFK